MEKQRQGQTVAIVALAVAIMVMAVGFAAATYSQTLNLNSSTATLKASKWSVHFDTTSYEESDDSIAATSKNVSDTSMNFTVTLPNPGDFYEFTTNVINDGTFDATLKKVTMSTLTSAEAKYLKYTITVGETSYTATTDNIGLALAKADGEHAVKVRVEYVMPENASDLPQEDATVTLTASLDYVSVD